MPTRARAWHPVLDLQGTEITDIGGDLHYPSLGYLNLGETNLNDVGIQHIAHLPRLRCLIIADTRVTNASIETLAAMPSLMEVYAYDTQIDQDSDQWLQLMKILKNRRANEEDATLQRHADNQPQSACTRD